MKKYLNFVKVNRYWDELLVINHIKMILNKYLGKPPSFVVHKDAVRDLLKKF